MHVPCQHDSTNKIQWLRSHGGRREFHYETPPVGVIGARMVDGRKTQKIPEIALPNWETVPECYSVTLWATLANGFPSRRGEPTMGPLGDSA